MMCRMKAYTEDLRKRIIKFRESGHSAEEAAKRYDVGKRSVERYWKSYLETGSFNKKEPVTRVSVLDKHKKTLLKWIKGNPSLTLDELRERCADNLGINITLQAIWYRLKKYGLSYKKTICAKEQNRDDIQTKRKHWRKLQARWDLERLVFIDETGFNTKMARRYGRSLRALRCVDYVPYGHWHTNTFIAGLRHDGVCAPMLFDGSMNAVTFLAYVSEVLVPTLHENDIVICDNLSSHKAAGVKEVIEKCGASIQYLPPYSPDMNPIEMLFSKMKAFLRKQACRSFDDILNATRDVLTALTPTQCSNFIQHAQYASIDI